MVVFLLVYSLAVGLIGAGISIFLRALPWPERWLKHPNRLVQKLWECAGCAGARGALLALLFVPLEPDLSFVALWLGATPIASILYRAVFPPALELP